MKDLILDVVFAARTLHYCMMSPASEMIFPMSYPSLDRTFLCMTRSQCSITGSDMLEL